MKIVSMETIFLHKTLPKLPSYIPLEIAFAQTMLEHHGSSGGMWTLGRGAGVRSAHCLIS